MNEAYSVEREGRGLMARYVVRDAAGVRVASFSTVRAARAHAKERALPAKQPCYHTTHDQFGAFRVTGTCLQPRYKHDDGRITAHAFVAKEAPAGQQGAGK